MTVDYHHFTTIETAQAQRSRLGVGDIWINAAECRYCGALIRSKNRHDFVTCKCGRLSVDGGSWYLRRMCEPGGSIDHSVMFADASRVSP